MRFKRGRCKVLHWWRINTMHEYRLGPDQLETAQQKKIVSAVLQTDHKLGMLGILGQCSPASWATLGSPLLASQLRCFSTLLNTGVAASGIQLPQEVVELSLSEVHRIHLDTFLDNLLQVARLEKGLDQTILRGHFLLQLLCDSIVSQTHVLIFQQSVSRSLCFLCRSSA